MTSEQISQHKQVFEAEAFWLKEIAYQLAVRNERDTPLTRDESFALSDKVMLAIRDREKNRA